MQFFARFSPFRAINDLRRFLAQRQPYELGFLALAIVVTTLIIAGFVHDSSEPVPYKRDITYFKSWSANRSEADILADRQRDFVEKTKRDVTVEKRQADSKESFKRYDAALKKWGI